MRGGGGLDGADGGGGGGGGGGGAPLESPAFTGTPTVPTAAPGTNNTQIASTAYADAAVVGLAPLSSPALTGTPTAPTPSAGDNDTSISTTAFVNSAIAARVLTGEGSATWAANAQTVWSYTLAEGEEFGGSMHIVTAYDNAGALARSIADVSFVGSRDVGGAAAVTQGTATENGAGSLASGTVTATAVGNTIAVRLTFPNLNGTAYFAWSLIPLAPPLP